MCTLSFFPLHWSLSFVLFLIRWTACHLCKMREWPWSVGALQGWSVRTEGNWIPEAGRWQEGEAWKAGLEWIWWHSRPGMDDAVIARSATIYFFLHTHISSLCILDMQLLWPPYILLFHQALSSGPLHIYHSFTQGTFPHNTRWLTPWLASGSSVLTVRGPSLPISYKIATSSSLVLLLNFSS